VWSPWRQRKQLSFKTGDLLKEVQIKNVILLFTGQEKVDLLIQATGQ
jgi:hypothetical protein